MIWAGIILFLVVAFAVWFQRMGTEVLEEDNVFLGVVGLFLLVFIVAAVALKFLVPEPAENADVIGMFRAFIEPIFPGDQL